MKVLSFERFKDVCFYSICVTYLVGGVVFYTHTQWFQAAFILALLALCLWIRPMYRAYVRLHNYFSRGD